MDGITELQAICEVCVSAIGDGEGAVWIEPPAPRMPRDSDRAESLHELGRVRDQRVAWHVTHDECGPTRAGYRIEVERIRTWAAYLHWTAHLMDKDWVGDTNWSDLVLDSLNPTSATAGGIRPLTVRDPGHRNVGD